MSFRHRYNPFGKEKKMENLDLAAIGDLLKTAFGALTDLFAKLEESGALEKIGAFATETLLPALEGLLGSIGA